VADKLGAYTDAVAGPVINRYHDNADGTWSLVAAVNVLSSPGGYVAKATAAAPTYVEGTIVPLSVDLAGTLRSGGGAASVDVTDRAGRLVGVVYGSQAAQLVQTPTNFNLKTEIAVGATLIDPRSIRALTSSDVVDVSDRAGRALGVVASITAVVHVDDNAASLTVDAPVATPVAVRLSDGAAFIDPRDVSDRAPRLLGIVDKGKVWDGTNIATVKAAAIAVNADNPLVVTIHPLSAPTVTQPVSIAAAVTVAQATPASLQATVTPAGASVWDVSDRAARLVGVVYGSQAQQLKQTATNFNSQVEVAVGATLIDPRSIRTLTTADNVTVTPPTLTKGTQGATGFSTQDLKDAGRVLIKWTAEFSPAAVAEALLTITESRDGAATSTFTSKVVTNGKRLRITSIGFSVENTLGASLQRAYLRMRFNTAGAVTTASPQQTVTAVQAAGTVKSITAIERSYPDGIEFLGDGTKQIGFTLAAPDWVSVTSTLKVYVSIFAYEY